MATRTFNIILFQQGNEDQLKYIYEKYWSRAVSWCKRMIGNERQAEDIVQEAMYKLWINRDSFNSLSFITGFLYRVIHDKGVNYLRSKARRASGLENMLHEYHYVPSNILSTQLVEAAVNYLKQVDKNAAIAIHYRYMLCYELQEAADASGINRLTLAQARRRGLARIAAWLEHEQIGAADWYVKQEKLLHRKRAKIVSYKEAQKMVQQAGVLSSTHYRQLREQKKVPDSLPFYPEKVYKNLGWVDWPTFVGRDSARMTKKSMLLSFAELQQKVRELGIKTMEEYFAVYETIPGAPKRPDIYYAEYTKWNDFTGTKRTPRNTMKNPPTYEDAKTWCRANRIIHKLDYAKRRPRSFPSSPSRHYKEWSGWEDFLGSREERGIIGRYYPRKKASQA